MDDPTSRKRRRSKSPSEHNGFIASDSSSDDDVQYIDTIRRKDENIMRSSQHPSINSALEMTQSQWIEHWKSLRRQVNHPKEYASRTKYFSTWDNIESHHDDSKPSEDWKPNGRNPFCGMFADPKDRDRSTEIIVLDDCSTSEESSPRDHSSEYEADGEFFVISPPSSESVDPEQVLQQYYRQLESDYQKTVRASTLMPQQIVRPQIATIVTNKKLIQLFPVEKLEGANISEPMPSFPSSISYTANFDHHKTQPTATFQDEADSLDHLVDRQMRQNSSQDNRLTSTQRSNHVSKKPA
eukprot:TRINITY_DN3925_c0_g1_i1.p1 TRINITY_DN3925_c0_g1~~TRINITY_DN3925_c0_g1_i1.p1  ORF type:complete len:297 (+),score=65.91 TRINITY_DN3925_c0_g1_i1:58-948(+)